jgi:asparagine synthase (glutamine-hydrolysing)
MCGIAGIIDFKKSGKGQQALSRMVDALEHRGPDDSGSTQLLFKNGWDVFLGHQRLSIIDLSQNGHQPMPNQDQTQWIVFNGEIYNFKEIKRNFTNNYSFRSNSDTEVVLAGYQQYGPKSLEHLRGMYAFCICDSRNETLFFARDRLGKKPLFYFKNEDFFIFSSEIRAILATKLANFSINPQGVLNYLSFGRSELPNSIISGIKEVKPAHFMEFSQNGLKETEYWNPFLSKSTIQINTPINEVIKKHLVESVEYRLVSDVPVGSFLSGGIDSSAITSIASQLSGNKIKTISMGFGDKEYDESKFAEMVAKRFKTDHLPYPLTESDLLDSLPKAISAMDQPTVDGINTYLISRCASQSGLKVALSGVGGDELFAGYESFYAIPKLKKIERILSTISIPCIAAFGKLFDLPFLRSDKTTKFSHLIQGKYVGAYYLVRSLFCQEQVNGLVKDESFFSKFLEDFAKEADTRSKRLANISEIDQISYLELTHYMTNMLLRDTDCMGMAHGLEIRAPLLDHKLVELMFQVPSNLKIQSSKPKPLLLDSLPEKLPDEAVFRKKMGFTIPLQLWMKTRLKKEVEEVLLTPVAQLEDILEEKSIRKVWNDFLDDKVSWSRPWALYVLKKWVTTNLSV